MPERKDSTIQFRVPQAVIDKLDAVCNRLDIRRSDYMRKLLAKTLMEAKTRRRKK